LHVELQEVRAARRFKAWAEGEGLAVYTGRRNARLGLEESVWHNTFKEGEDGSREEIVAKYKTERLPELLANGNNIEELRGKALGCYCKPDDECHVDVLIEKINESATSYLEETKGGEGGARRHPPGAQPLRMHGTPAPRSL
jgi:Domain of unknown function (DUF4326)